MSFERHRCVQQITHLHRLHDGLVEPQPRNRSRSTAAQSRPNRNVAMYIHFGGRERATVLAREKIERPLDVVLALELLADEVELQLTSTFNAASLKPQIELHCNRKNIEARPQVHHRGRDRNLNLSAFGERAHPFTSA